MFNNEVKLLLLLQLKNINKFIAETGKFMYKFVRI